MKVKGKIEVEVELSPYEAVQSLCERFEVNFFDLDNYIVKEINGIKGVYYNQHELHYCEYTLIHEGKTACEILNSLKLLKSNLQYLYIGDCKKGNTRERLK